MDTLLRLIRRILSKEQRRFVKFCIVGASGVPVNLLCTWLAYAGLAAVEDAPRKAVSSLIGIAVSILTNFLLNDLWTWRDREKATRGFWGRLLRFYVVSSVAAVIQWGAAMALALGLDLHLLLAQLVGIALATGVNFVVNNLWTFRARRGKRGHPEP